jgi:WD40 repeat protein
MVRLWDAATGKELRTLKGLTDWVYYVSWSPDGKTLGTSSGGGAITLWDGEGKIQATLKGQYREFVTWSPDGKALAWSTEVTSRLCDVTGKTWVTFKAYAGAVNAVSWSPDGKTLASANTQGMVQLWDAATGKERAILKGHTGEVSSVSWSPDGKTLATASRDRTVMLWNVAAAND